MTQRQPIDWRAFALCRGINPSLFFPGERGPDGSNKWRAKKMPRAKAVCAECPVTAPCIDDALRTERDDQLGVRGGLTPAELRRLYRKRRDEGTL